MDPEYELAIKISEYFEFLWDGRVPVWLLANGNVSVTFAALLPLDLTRYDAEPGVHLTGLLPLEESFRNAVMRCDHVAVTQAIRKFLQSRGQRKPRLRRAAKCAGLWMRVKGDFEEGHFADRYVPPLEQETDRLPSSSREFHTAAPADEDRVIADLTEQSSGLIAFDLIAIADSLQHHPFAGVFPTAAAMHCEHQAYECSLSVASLQYDLTSHFFRFPLHMSEISEALRFVPSFTARVADTIVALAPAKGTSWFRRVLEENLYSAAAAFFRGHDRPPMDVKVGAGLRRRRIDSTADLVEAIVCEINPRALDGYERSARVSKIAACEVNPVFAISLYLLEQKPWCVMIADTFNIPAPFGVVLAEELDQVDQSRAVCSPIAQARYG